MKTVLGLKVEGRYNWRGPPIQMIIHAFLDGCSICIRHIQNRLLYIRQIFLIQMKYRLQSMYNHIVGRAASVVSPLYFISHISWTTWDDERLLFWLSRAAMRQQENLMTLTDV